MQLYRHFNPAGELLYVGISVSHLARLADHEGSHWFREICRVDIEHLESKRAAVVAEREAIARENPKYNLSRPGCRRPLALSAPSRARALAHRLKADSVQAQLPPGLYADGGNLYLRVDDGGAKRWTFIFRSGGRRREMGLGRVLDVSLKEARAAAARARDILAAGGDPIEQRRREAA